MTLSNEQRLLVYKKLLKVVCKDPSVKYGMCNYLGALLDHSNEMPLTWSLYTGVYKMRHLPELNKHSQNDYVMNNLSGYWAPLDRKGWETRIGWIEQAIIDVKKLIK
jgi:hypothetical protein